MTKNITQDILDEHILTLIADENVASKPLGECINYHSLFICSKPHMCYKINRLSEVNPKD